MAKADKTYTRLTRNTAGVASYSNLWLASDHILIVSSTGYSEGYARVLLRDIKALFVVRTDRRLWWSMVWGVIGLISLLRVLYLSANGEWPVGSGLFLAVSLIGYGLNFYWGRGCRVYFITGVQTAVLPSLVRMRRTRRVLAKLQPLIVAAQADLVPARPPPTGDAMIETPEPTMVPGAAPLPPEPPAA